ncbi:MAG: hypothetical protein RI897_3011 [Verrucomicrobiota bacterium]
MFVGVGAGFRLEAGGQGIGLLQGEGAIEEVQGLEGGVGAAALRDDLVAVGAIERAEDGILFLTDLEEVDHAAEFGGADFFLGVVVHDVFDFDIVEVEAGAAHGEVQGTGDGEDAVADGFGFEAAWGEAPEQGAGGIDGEGKGLGVTGLLEGVGCEDELLDVFDGPSVLDEFGGEPVEEFRVSGRDAVGAEVTGGGGDAGAEGVVPEAVDEDAGGEWVLGVGDPVGELGAALLFGGVHGEAECAEDGERVGGDGFTWGEGVSTVEAVGGFGLGEGAGPDHLVTAELVDLGLGSGDLLLESFGCVGLCGGQAGEESVGVWFVVVGEAGVGRGDGGPGLEVRGGFDGIACGEAVLEGVVTVAAPADFRDGLGFGKLDLYPAGFGGVGDPAPVVAVAAVVDVLEFMGFVAG